MNDVELAQWLEETHLESLKVSLNAKMLKNAGFTIDDHKKWAWLLTARQLQKRVLAEIDVVQNKYCLDTDNEGEHCHDVEPPCDMCDAFEELKSHFLKDGEDK